MPLEATTQLRFLDHVVAVATFLAALGLVVGSIAFGEQMALSW